MHDVERGGGLGGRIVVGVEAAIGQRGVLVRVESVTVQAI